MGEHVLQFLVNIFVEFGLLEGVFTAFFFGAHGVIYKLYQGRLIDRQNEIDRLAVDNREYRERFLSLIDAKFSYSLPLPGTGNGLTKRSGKSANNGKKRAKNSASALNSQDASHRQQAAKAPTDEERSARDASHPKEQPSTET